MSETLNKKAETAGEGLSLWCVKAGGKVSAVKLRSDRSVKEAVAETAKALKKRYQAEQGLGEVRAGRIGR